MENPHKIYYTTGELAKLCGINKKTLFHYDEIGLLKPEKIADNGYRYYSSNQLELFNVISILKELNMPLKEIKNFLDTRTPEKTRELFKAEKLLVQKEIEKLKKIQTLLDIKLKDLTAGQNTPSEIILEKQEEEALVLSSKVKNIPNSYDVNAYARLISYCMDYGLECRYPIGSILKKEKLLCKDYKSYDYYFAKLSQDQFHPNSLIKPKGLYIVGYHHGYYSTIDTLYQKMTNFIEANHLNIIGDAYEEALIDEIAAKDYSQFVIKVSILCST